MNALLRIQHPAADCSQCYTLMLAAKHVQTLLILLKMKELAVKVRLHPEDFMMDVVFHSKYSCHPVHPSEEVPQCCTVQQC